jgi:hypothetical protein
VHHCEGGVALTVISPQPAVQPAVQAAAQPGKQGGLPKWLGIAGASYLSRRGEIEVELLIGIRQTLIRCCKMW